MKKNSSCVEFKLLFFSKNLEKWEDGENRLLCPDNLEYLHPTISGAYNLDLIWNKFTIIFNLHYPVVPPNNYIQINFIDSPETMKNPIKMEFKKEKTMIKIGIEISGFWIFTLILDNYIVNNHYLDFVYKYSILNEESNINVLERIEKRKLRILLNDKYTEKAKEQYSSSLLLKNSKIEIIDVNFVALLDFDQIGDKKYL